MPTNEKKPTRTRTEHRVMPLPKSTSAPAHVTIDGRHYASFASLAAAKEAVAAWTKGWAAVEGEQLKVVTS